MSQLFIGTSGWAYRHWGEGHFYPEKLRTYEQLAFYAQHFGTVELNVTFYRYCRPSTYEKWRDTTPAGFVFAAKVHRDVTHRRRLVEVAEPLGDMLAAAQQLGAKLGPLLFQLPPSFQADAQLLADTLALLPPGIRSTWEPRHRSWFAEETYRVLRETNAALTIADSPRYACVEEVTADFVYIRLHGHDKMYASSYTDQQLAEWASKVRRWLDEGRDVYVYFDNDVEGAAPPNARTLQALLEQRSPP